MTKKFDPTADNFDRHQDDFYEALMEAHSGLSDDQSNRLNARLVLLMANQIGDIYLLEEILNAAGKGSQ